MFSYLIFLQLVSSQQASRSTIDCLAVIKSNKIMLD